MMVSKGSRQGAAKMAAVSSARAIGLACLIVGLVAGNAAVAAESGHKHGQGQSHGKAATSQPSKHGGEHASKHKSAAKTKVPVDLYLLKIDPVTGKKLPALKRQVILVHEGRQLRFASKRTLNQFKANPAKYLPKIDRHIVAQQLAYYPLKTCVVSGEKLEDMGKPIDFVYRNRLVRFCCKSCRKEFVKSPAKFLKKIDAAVIAAQKPKYPLKTCVVSGEKLEDMGKPIEKVIGNRLVSFCCKHCVKQFRSDPVKYMAVLDKAAKAHHKGKPGATSQPHADSHAKPGHAEQGKKQEQHHEDDKHDAGHGH
jgi:YHS domain-containing protein